MAQLCKRTVQRGFWLRGLSLSAVKEGNTVKLLYINRKGYLRKRLSELGFIAGEDIFVIKNTGKGAVVVTIKDSRIVLGRGESKKVIVDAG